MRRQSVQGGHPGGRPTRSPAGLLAAAGVLAATLLAGAAGTGVVTVSRPSAAPAAPAAPTAPAECRDVTLFAVNGSGAAGGETLAAVTDPLVQQVGERLAVVAVAGPEVGASYGAGEQQAVTTLTDQVAAQLAACPEGSAMLFGYSQGAHVAGDVAGRIGAGRDTRIPADRILAVGLFGDPARDPAVRTVPDGVSGQGVFPAREGGFGALAARTIQVCAPEDPVCAGPAGGTAPSLEQAVAAPAHIDYPQLAVAPGTPATRWASDSLGRLITSLPAAGTPTPGSSTSTTTSTTTGAPTSTTTANPAAPSTGTSSTTTSTTTSAVPGQPPAQADDLPEGGGDVYADGGAGAYPGAADTGAAYPGATDTGAAYPGATETGGAYPGAADTGAAYPGAVGTSTTAGTTTTTTTTPAATGGSTATASPEVAPASGGGTYADGSAPTTSTAPTGAATTSTAPPGDDADDEGSGGGAVGQVPGALWTLTSGLAGFQESSGGNVEGGGLEPVEVESPNVPGRRVVKLEVPEGGKRSEVRPREAQRIRAGERLFFGYSAFLPDDFPVDADSWQVVWQLHDGETNTSPPVALEIVDGRLWLTNVGDRGRDLGPVQAGRNLDVQLDITFELGGGEVTVYRGGQQVLQGFRPPRGTMIDSFDYLKTGIYRSSDTSGGGATLFLNDLKIGETLESVSGLAGAEAPAGAGSGGTAPAAGEGGAGDVRAGIRAAGGGGTDASNTGAGTGTSTTRGTR